MPATFPDRAVHRCACPSCQHGERGTLARAHRDINRVLATLNERQRRLFVGFLARDQGYGGIHNLARITGLSRNTVRRGMRDIGRWRPTSRIRRRGGGRKPVETVEGASSGHWTSCCVMPSLVIRSPD